jgi:hypothetical protein
MVTSGTSIAGERQKPHKKTDDENGIDVAIKLKQFLRKKKKKKHTQTSHRGVTDFNAPSP